MRDKILECHAAWMLGYLGYLLLIFLPSTTEAIHRSPSAFYALISCAKIFSPAPIIGLLSCLCVCLQSKHRHPTITQHCKETINFQISYTGYQFGLSLLLYLVTGQIPTVINSGQGFIVEIISGLLIVLIVFIVLVLAIAIEFSRFMLTIIALKKTSRGEFYHYPGNLQLW